MRRGRDNGFLNDKHGRVIAVNLGADHCAEHEWGIDGIRRAFGMTEGFGIERRRTRKATSTLRWVTGTCEVGPYGKKRQKVGWEGFWLSPYARDGESPGHEVPSFYGDQTLSTGWSGTGTGDFGAFSIKHGEVNRLREIYNALHACDGVIWLGGGGVFQNAGLVVGIASRLDADVVAEWDKADREAAKLREDFAATGLEVRLRAAGKEWFALSPMRKADGSIQVWLNPRHQRVDNFGWFTIAELDAWAHGKGPVPMTEQQKRERGSW